MNRSAVLKGFFFTDNVAPRTNVHRDDSREKRESSSGACTNQRLGLIQNSGREKNPTPLCSGFLPVYSAHNTHFCRFLKSTHSRASADFNADLLWVLGFSFLHCVPENSVGTRAPWGRDAEWKERVVPQFLLPHQALDDPWGVASCHI